MDDHEALFVAGCAATGATLAAGHFFRWWKPLGRLTAYAFGCVAILLGQGVLLKFNKTWRRLCAIAERLDTQNEHLDVIREHLDDTGSALLKIAGILDVADFS